MRVPDLVRRLWCRHDRRIPYYRNIGTSAAEWIGRICIDCGDIDPRRGTC